MNAYCIIYKKQKDIAPFNGALAVFEKYEDAEFTRLFYPAKKNMKVVPCVISMTPPPKGER